MTICFFLTLHINYTWSTEVFQERTTSKTQGFVSALFLVPLPRDKVNSLRGVPGAVGVWCGESTPSGEERCGGERVSDIEGAPGAGGGRCGRSDVREPRSGAGSGAGSGARGGAGEEPGAGREQRLGEPLEQCGEEQPHPADRGRQEAAQGPGGKCIARGRRRTPDRAEAPLSPARRAERKRKKRRPGPSPGPGPCSPARTPPQLGPHSRRRRGSEGEEFPRTRSRERPPPPPRPAEGPRAAPASLPPSLRHARAPTGPDPARRGPHSPRPGAAGAEACRRPGVLPRARPAAPPVNEAPQPPPRRGPR
ncbi:proline-rich protein 2-like [Canis lupus dingo]|uniref:proline-rich protein 2-like n=1 Tax=Canis lupus dingo TaxID=286419 RepID=UPI000DC6CC0F|nr:proline-rich protein 2-like [Canis lupus dingo]